MIDLSAFLPVWCVAICLMADFLKGIQPKDLCLASGRLVRQLSLAFLNCLRDLA